MPRNLGLIAAITMLLAAGACGGGGSTGGSGGSPATGGTGGPSAGAGGGAQAGGAGASGGAGRGAGGSGGTGGVPATGGAGEAGGRAGAGQAGAGGAGGAAGGAGAAGGGAGGGGRGGAAGQGGAGADPTSAAAVLDGFALLKPCFSTPASCAGCTCDENPSNILNTGVAPENQHIVKQFGGDAAATYDVKLRVAGVAERYWYTGGTLDPTSKVFYTGGLPTIHSAQAPNQNLAPGAGACKIHPPQTDSSYPIPFAVPADVAPADNCYNGFNIFAVTVSSPKQTYFFNYTTDYDGVDRQPHAVYKTDYTVTIPIAGQATLDFYVIDGDHHEVANTTMTVANIKNTTIKQPYVGNFLELEVLGVTVAK